MVPGDLNREWRVVFQYDEVDFTLTAPIVDLAEALTELDKDRALEHLAPVWRTASDRDAAEARIHGIEFALADAALAFGPREERAGEGQIAGLQRIQVERGGVGRNAEEEATRRRLNSAPADSKSICAKRRSGCAERAPTRARTSRSTMSLK
jgi:hypothetical protein